MYHHGVTGFIHNSVFACLFFSVCVCIRVCMFACMCVRAKKRGVSVMCQGRETYGERQSEVERRVQPGHVSTVMEDIFSTWTLNTSLPDIVSVGVRLLLCV